MKLKPCPFCGGNRIQFNVEGYFQPWEGEGMRLWFRCTCHDCGCTVDDGCCTDMKKAAVRWNTRVGDDLMERMEDDGK